jgi:hypothetical protein
MAAMYSRPYQVAVTSGTPTRTSADRHPSPTHQARNIGGDNDFPAKTWFYWIRNWWLNRDRHRSPPFGCPVASSATAPLPVNAHAAQRKGEHGEIARATILRRATIVGGRPSWDGHRQRGRIASVLIVRLANN